METRIESDQRNEIVMLDADAETAADVRRVGQMVDAFRMQRLRDTGFYIPTRRLWVPSR